MSATSPARSHTPVSATRRRKSDLAAGSEPVSPHRPESQQSSRRTRCPGAGRATLRCVNADRERRPTTPGRFAVRVARTTRDNRTRMPSASRQGFRTNPGVGEHATTRPERNMPPQWPIPWQLHDSRLPEALASRNSLPLHARTCRSMPRRKRRAHSPTSSPILAASFAIQIARSCAFLPSAPHSGRPGRLFLTFAHTRTHSNRNPSCARESLRDPSEASGTNVHLARPHNPPKRSRSRTDLLFVAQRVVSQTGIAPH